MDKFTRISEFAKHLFANEKQANKAGSTPEGILDAQSPRINDIAGAMPGEYEANYKQVQRFLAEERTPKEQLRLWIAPLDKPKVYRQVYYMGQAKTECDRHLA